jgi:transposase-like protein
MKNKPSIASLARKHGLYPATVKARLKHGWSLKEALTVPVRKIRLSKASLTGKASLARKHGLSPNSVYKRLKNGQSLKEALATPPQGVSNPNSIAALARKHGVNPATVQERVGKYGWSLEKALTTPVRIKNEYNPSIAALARKHGLKSSIVYGRLNTSGWSLEKALTTPVQIQIGPCRKFGVIPVVSATSVNERMQRGMSLAEAATTPPAAFTIKRSAQIASIARQEKILRDALYERFNTRGELTKRGISKKELMNALREMDVVPPTISFLARKYRLNPGTVYQRLKYGRDLTKPVNGEIAKQARANDLNYGTLNSRLKKLGWSLKEALSTRPKARCNFGITVAARARGLSRQAVLYRLKHGWSMEEALATPVGEKRGGAPNFTAVARAHGLDPSTVRGRLKWGWSMEEALATPARKSRASKTSITGAARVDGRSVDDPGGRKETRVI